MWMDLTPIELISIASFAIAVSGIAIRFFIKNPTSKGHVTAAVLLFVIVVLGINIFHSSRRARDARQLSHKIVEVLGNGEKTIDQLIIELNNPDLKLFSRAFASISSEGRIDSRLEEVYLTRKQTVHVRLWRASDH